jgi:hypothetical protein
VVQEKYSKLHFGSITFDTPGKCKDCVGTSHLAVAELLNRNEGVTIGVPRVRMRVDGGGPCSKSLAPTLTGKSA